MPTAQESRDQVCRVSGGELSAIEDSRPSQTGLLQRPFYAVLLAATLVLAVYGGTHVSPNNLIRPLIVFPLVAALEFVVIGTLTRRWHLAAFAVAVGLVMVADKPVFWFLLIVPWLALTLRSVRRKAGLDATPQLTRPLNVVVAIWFAIAAATAVWVTLPGSLPTPVSISMRPGPNLYMILLDGYPRADTLAEYFGFDNGPFLRALEDRGFDVAENSGGPYNTTVRVVPTMMQMRTLEQLLEGAPADSNASRRRLWQLLNAAPVPAAFHDAGFTTYSIPPPAPGVDWHNADIVRESPWLSVFEEHLIGSGILRPILPLQAMQRATILDNFRYLEESAGSSPRFVFAHIYSPHFPYVFAADGTPAAACGAECANHAGPPNAILGDRLTGQIRFLNEKVLKALDHIIAVDSEATIVVFSDHGLRRDRADPDEWVRTLFAARNQPFPDNVTTLDIFPTLLHLARSPSD